MPVLDVTEEQVVALLEQMTPEQRARIINRFATAPAHAAREEQPARKRARFGSGRNAIIYMADDFDAPLEDMKEYME